MPKTFEGEGRLIDKNSNSPTISNGWGFFVGFNKPSKRKKEEPKMR